MFSCPIFATYCIRDFVNLHTNRPCVFLIAWSQLTTYLFSVLAWWWLGFGTKWHLKIRPWGYVSCSTQLSMKLFLAINVTMPTIGILTLTSRKKSIIGVSEPGKSWISWYFYTYKHVVSCSAELSMITFYNLAARLFINGSMSGLVCFN